MSQEPKNYEELKGILGKALTHVHSGKVRDSYLLELKGRKLRLVVTSDRVSIFDFMLGFQIPGKGEILNAFNLAARRVLQATMPAEFKDDMVAFGAGIDEYLPSEFRNCTLLQRCAVVVEELPMMPIECVVRGHLTGTGYKAYKKTGSVCGHILPEGLVEGAELPHVLFTPTTKAAQGHDEDLDHKEVEAEYPGLTHHVLKAFGIFKGLAHANGIILVDTKFELALVHYGLVPRFNQFVFADEVMTPDSSRLWDMKAYKIAMAKGRLPASMDKQIIRDWGVGVGISKLNPEISGDAWWVLERKPQLQVIFGARRQMLKAFRRLYGTSLRGFQREFMGIQ